MYADNTLFNPQKGEPFRLPEMWSTCCDGCQRGGAPVIIESIKTTSMEDVSTRVLEKIKNI